MAHQRGSALAGSMNDPVAATAAAKAKNTCRLGLKDNGETADLVSSIGVYLLLSEVVADT
jgi:hypothetical protein